MSNETISEIRDKKVKILCAKYCNCPFADAVQALWAEETGNLPRMAAVERVDRRQPAKSLLSLQ